MAGILTTAAAPALGWYHDLLDFFFPPVCLVCNAYSGDLPICPDCNDRLVTLPGPVCSQCRTFVEPGPDACPTHNSMIVWSAGLYDTYYRRLLHPFKFNGRMDAGAYLGQKLAEIMSRALPPIDALVPVPLHAARQRERGFNQSEHLAQTVGAALNIPVFDDLIKRTRNTPSQTELGRRARQQNVSGAFEVSQRHRNNMSILLVDDVFTTGATLEACQTALTEAGFQVAGASVVALAEPPGSQNSWLMRR